MWVGSGREDRTEVFIALRISFTGGAGSIGFISHITKSETGTGTADRPEVESVLEK
jgi:hypothetical protein